MCGSSRITASRIRCRRNRWVKAGGQPQAPGARSQRKPRHREGPLTSTRPTPASLLMAVVPNRWNKSWFLPPQGTARPSRHRSRSVLPKGRIAANRPHHVYE